MTYCNILIYCLLSSFLHAFWTFQFVQLSFDLGDIIFWMMRENEKKDESKKTSSSGKKVLCPHLCHQFVCLFALILLRLSLQLLDEIEE